MGHGLPRLRGDGLGASVQGRLPAVQGSRAELLGVLMDLVPPRRVKDACHRRRTRQAIHCTEPDPTPELVSHMRDMLKKPWGPWGRWPYFAVGPLTNVKLVPSPTCDPLSYPRSLLRADREWVQPAW